MRAGVVGARRFLECFVFRVRFRVYFEILAFPGVYIRGWSEFNVSYFENVAGCAVLFVLLQMEIFNYFILG